MSGIPRMARTGTKHEYKAETSWKERHEHSAYVFQDKIWVAGGHAQPRSSDVWSLEISRDWFKDPPHLPAKPAGALIYQPKGFQYHFPS